MQVIIDRFDGDFAVVELQNKTMIDMPKCLLPSDSLEGNVISIEIDRGETAKRVASIRSLETSLFEE